MFHNLYLSVCFFSVGVKKANNFRLPRRYTPESLHAGQSRLNILFRIEASSPALQTRQAQGLSHFKAPLDRGWSELGSTLRNYPLKASSEGKLKLRE